MKIYFSPKGCVHMSNSFRINTEHAPKHNFDLLHSYRPIYIVLRIFGLMPFSIVFDSNGDIHRPVVRKLDALWFLISMVAFNCFMYFSFKYFNSEENIKPLSTTSFVGNACVYGISSTICLLSLVLDMCFRFKFVNIFKKITIFDKQVNFKF